MTEILMLIAGIFKFWDEVTALVKMLQATPEEQHANLLASIQEEAQKLKTTGRPTWG